VSPAKPAEPINVPFGSAQRIMYHMGVHISIESDLHQNCVGDVVDVIACAKFENEIIRGYDFTAGSNFPFSY